MKKYISLISFLLLALVVVAQPLHEVIVAAIPSIDAPQADNAAQNDKYGKSHRRANSSRSGKRERPNKTDSQSQSANSGKRRSSTHKKEKTKLWAILIADTEDESIGEDDRLDNKRLNSELSDIAKALDIDYKIINITGENAYRKTKLAKTIDNLKPSSNDIVFFCFNGHGFRWDDQNDQYPMLYLYNGRDEFTNQYVAASDIYEAIVAKGARLNIIITDCCNAQIGAFKPSQEGSTLYSRPTTPVSKERLQALFLKSKGNTLIASAKPGEYSYSFANYGSAFTQAFLRAIHNESSSEQTGNVSWVRIIDSSIRAAREKTSSCESTQHGIRFTTVKAVK